MAYLVGFKRFLEKGSRVQETALDLEYSLRIGSG